jgi:uncharacterized protein YaaR (DUF327 family)
MENVIKSAGKGLLATKTIKTLKKYKKKRKYIRRKKVK